MAITTYAELKTAIARIAGGSDASTATTLGLTSTIDDLVTLGETRILREARTKDQEATLSTTGTVPSDFVQLKIAFISGYPPLEQRPLEWIRATYPTGSGLPKYIAREGQQFVFGPTPDSGYTISGVYYKRLIPLATAVHALFLNNPDLYLFACLAEADILLGHDNRIALWETKYKKILNDVNAVDRSSVGNGSFIQMRVA